MDNSASKITWKTSRRPVSRLLNNGRAKLPLSRVRYKTRLGRSLSLPEYTNINRLPGVRKPGFLEKPGFFDEIGSLSEIAVAELKNSLEFG